MTCKLWGIEQGVIRHACLRPEYWFWDSFVHGQSFFPVLAQVLATFLNTYFPLTIMLMILALGFGLLTQTQPFQAGLSQRLQVNHSVLKLQTCFSVQKTTA